MLIIWKWPDIYKGPLFKSPSEKQAVLFSNGNNVNAIGVYYLFVRIVEVWIWYLIQCNQGLYTGQSCLLCFIVCIYSCLLSLCLHQGAACMVLWEIIKKRQRFRQDSQWIIKSNWRICEQTTLHSIWQSSTLI